MCYLIPSRFSFKKALVQTSDLYMVYRVRQGVGRGGWEWYGALTKCVGHWPKRFGRKTQKGPTKYNKLLKGCSRCTPSTAKIVPNWPAISVINWQQWSLGQKIWFGLLSAISQRASRVGGEGESGICSLYHYTTWLSGECRCREGCCVPCPWFKQVEVVLPCIVAIPK